MHHTTLAVLKIMVFSPFAAPEKMLNVHCIRMVPRPSIFVLILKILGRPANSKNPIRTLLFICQEQQFLRSVVTMILLMAAGARIRNHLRVLRPSRWSK